MQQRAAGLLLWAQQAGDSDRLQEIAIDCCIGGQQQWRCSTALGSKASSVTLTADVGS